MLRTILLLQKKKKGREITLILLVTELWFFHPVLSLIAVYQCIIVCVEVLRPSQPNGVMSSAVSLPNHTFTGQA